MIGHNQRNPYSKNISTLKFQKAFIPILFPPKSHTRQIKIKHEASHPFQVMLKRVGLLSLRVTRSLTTSAGEWNWYHEQSRTVAGSDVGMADHSASSQTPEVSCTNAATPETTTQTQLNAVCFLGVLILSTAQFI